jgi:hypothetical protein
MLVLRSGRACGLRGAAVVIAMLAATNREPMEYSQKEERFMGGRSYGAASETLFIQRAAKGLPFWNCLSPGSTIP